MDIAMNHSTGLNRWAQQTRLAGSYSILGTLGLVLLSACVNTSDNPSVPMAAGAPSRTCGQTIQTKVSASKPTVKVVYTEPVVNQAGSPLKDLVKTSIYYDLGAGRVLAKDVPAAKSTGGGQISETITVPVTGSGDTAVSFCVTATDRFGNESMTTP